MLALMVCLVAAATVAPTALAHAATQVPRNKLRVTPVKTELSVRPGETVDQVIIVQNQGLRAFHLTVSVSDYLTTSDGSFVYSRGSEPTYSCAQWIHLGDTSMTLAPGAVVRYPVRLAVPRNAEPGGKNAAVIFAMSTGPPDQSDVGINGRIASQMLVTVGGNELREEGVVGELSISKSPMSRDVESQIAFQNRGNVHLNVEQEVVYTNFMGQVVGKYAEPAVTVLPTSDRTLMGRWTAPYVGWFTAQSTVRYGMDASQTNRIISPDPVSFWVVSPEAIVVAALAVIALIIAMSAVWWIVVNRHRHVEVIDAHAPPTPRRPQER